MRTWTCCLTLLVGFAGCSAPTPAGTETDARRQFDAEFKKWMSGQESQVATMESAGKLLPISYDIRSVVADEPTVFSHASGSDLPDDWKSWPAYRFNVAIEWKSKAGTPVEKVTTYTATWNAHEKRWYIQERFL